MKYHFPLFNKIAACLTLSLTAAIAAPPLLEQVSFDHLENDTILFKTSSGTAPPKPLKTGLFDLTYLGALPSDEGGLPFFLFSGKPCQNCLDDRTIYAIHPNGEKPTAFVYPGKIFEPSSRALLLESRAFFGKCLPRRGAVFIIFQKEKIDRRRQLQSSVYIAEAKKGKDYFEENLIERHLPQLKNTLQMVKRKLCYEIEGRNRLMLSKPLDLHPHVDVNNDENDDNDNGNDDSLEKSREEISNSPLFKIGG